MPRCLPTARFLALALIPFATFWAQTRATTAEQGAQLQAAYEHLQQGNVDLTIRECKSVLAVNPQSAPAHMLLGQAYLKQGTIAVIAESKAELQQALDLDPDLLWARFYLARVYIDQGLYERARSQLERGLEQRPNVPHFLCLLGEVRRKLGDPAAALELSRKALQIDPTLTPAHYYMALAYLDLKQEDAAIAELEGSIRSKYVSPEMYNALGDLYRQRRRFAQAEDLCRKAIALDRTRPEAYLTLARLYNTQHASDKALQIIRQALPEGKEVPASEYYQKLQADLLVEQGAAYQAKGAAAQAIQAYTHALELDDRGAVHGKLAELYLKAGDSARAIEHATAAEKLGVHVDPAVRSQIFK